MLILTRKPMETIRIGEDVVIRVTRIGKGAVKLGIEAPATVRVMRGELSDAGESIVCVEPALSVARQEVA